MLSALTPRAFLFPHQLVSTSRSQITDPSRPFRPIGPIGHIRLIEPFRHPLVDSLTCRPVDLLTCLLFSKKLLVGLKFCGNFVIVINDMIR